MLQVEFVDREKERLTAERTRLVEEIAHLRTSNQAEIEAEEGHAEIQDKEKGSALLTFLRHKLHEVDAALSVIAKGEYGLCRRCHFPIGVEHTISYSCIHTDSNPDPSTQTGDMQAILRQRQTRIQGTGSLFCIYGIPIDQTELSESSIDRLWAAMSSSVDGVL